MCVGSLVHFATKQNQINTPERLFVEFVKAKKANNFGRMKSISCPVLVASALNIIARYFKHTTIKFQSTILVMLILL